MSYEHDDDSFPEEREAWDGDRLTQDADDAAERAAYDEDVAAQNAVDDAKYETPEQDEPPEGYYDRPTHYQEAEESLSRLDNVEFGTGKLREELALIQAQATLAVAEELGELRGLVAHRLPHPREPWEAGSKSPADPAELGAWLRNLSHATILRDRAGFAWQRMWGANFNHGDDSRDQWPALYSVGLAEGRSLKNGEDGSPGEDLRVLADRAPFTVLDPGAPF